MSGNISSRRPAERLTADERRQAAMAATMRLLSTMRYEDLLMEDIAAKAGMSRPLLYHYFGGKEQVTAAAVRWYGRQLIEEIHRTAVTQGSRWLPAAVGTYLDYLSTRSSWYTVLYRHAHLPFAEMEAVRTEIRLRIIGGLHTRLAPDGSSPVLRSLLGGWVGQVETMCQEWLTHSEPSREILEPLLCELLAAALRSGGVVDTVTRKASVLLAST